MTRYHILIEFTGALDLKGKISASLAIRKMIERLTNEYDTHVQSVQDTKCEITLRSNSPEDISGSLRSTLEGMTGGMACQISVRTEADNDEISFEIGRAHV